MIPGEPQKVRMGCHLEIIRASFISTGIYFGGYNPEFLKELGELMAKYQLRHLEAMLIPCPKEQVITVQVQDKKQEEDVEGP